MTQLFSIAGKDLRLLLNDKGALFFVLVFPIVYALFFGALFGGSGSNNQKIALVVVDEDSTRASTAFVARLRESSALTVTTSDLTKARTAVRKGKKTALLQLRAGFGSGQNFGLPGSTPRLELDPARQAEGGVLQGVIIEAIFDPLQELFSNPASLQAQAKKSLAAVEADESTPFAVRLALQAMFSTVDKLGATLAQQSRQGDPGRDKGPFAGGLIEVGELPREHRPGAQNAYEITFPSSILWGVLGCAAGFAITLVRERTLGTLQRLRAAPVSRFTILAGKGLACFLTCCGVITVLLLLGRLVFGVRILDPGLLAMAILATSLCFVGIMLLVSTLGKSEQSVAGAGWAVFVVLAMFGGGMVPLFMMPGWMAPISDLSPVKWSVLALEGAIWREFSLVEMLKPCAILLGIGAASFGVGMWRMPKLGD